MGLCVSKQNNQEKLNTKQINQNNFVQRFETITNVNQNQEFQIKPVQITQPDEEYKQIQQNIVYSQFHIRKSSLKRNERKKIVNLGVRSKKQVIYEKIQLKEKVKTLEDMQIILKAFSKNFFFTQLDKIERKEVIDKMLYCVVNDGKYIFEQNDKASLYFLIERGQCEIIINGQLKKTLNISDSFGELALLFNANRSASVKAVGNCGFWCIDHHTFRNLMEDINQREYDQNKKFIQKISFLHSLNEQQKDAISNSLVTLNFKSGENIVNEGDMANSYFIIKKGSVAVLKDGIIIRKIYEGDSFGEQALFQNSQRGATVRAIDEEVKCLALGRENLTQILGDQIQHIMYNNVIKWALEKDENLKGLTKIQMEKITMQMVQYVLKPNQIFLLKNQPLTEFYVLLEGSLRNIQTKEIIVTKGQLYAQEMCLKKNQNKLNPIDIEAGSDCLISKISLEAFFNCIGGEFEYVLNKNKYSHEIKYIKLYDSKERKDYSYIKFENLILVKKLGSGQFGNVFLVLNPADTTTFALKQINKKQIISNRLEKHLKQEKEVLEISLFPMIMNYCRSFKDENNIYFLNELVNGMELFDVIRELGIMNSQESQFYIASLILCMEYLHTNNIIYRDVKPENAMVDQNGFLKLIDMGTAKILSKSGQRRTFTIIGTPHYMAPEIMRGKGYSYNVDLWSIGICLYEFLYGAVPYAENTEDPYEIYEQIMNKPLQFPNFLKDKKSQKMIDQLLSKAPEQRLGGSYPALKAHPWFDQFDWDKLIEREMTPPFIPPKSKILGEKEQNYAIKNKIKVWKMMNKAITSKTTYKPHQANDTNWDQEY